MTATFPPPAPNVGRFTAVILFIVVSICVVMIGGTGYLKYQLDRSEILLAAPDAAVGSDQEMFDRLRRDLGYGGFLGLAQNYVIGHDASGFAEMKAHIKAADDIVAHLPDKTPAETRHDLVAIVSTFDTAMQKINAPAGEASELTAADLVPLYAALPILDSRVASLNGETRLAAQSRMQFWAMLLTLVSWCSLIIAAACAAGIYLTLRDKHSAPMRALAQSIQNMARGDMRTAIWGIERQDTIGELARSVDIARYHFSHLPDLSLLSEQGPVRMKFEGGSRSLFEAMMRAISRDSESIRQQAATLTETVESQKTSISQISEKVELVLGNILQRGQNGDAQITKAIHDMTASAESLKNAHAHAADQLNRLLPNVQDRVQNMAEIASITGKQVSQTLQALTLSEMALKTNAEQTKDTLARLFSTADDLGERMFGAINLLQAGGKVLAETTEKIQDKLLRSGGGESPFAPVAVFDSSVLQPLVQRLDQVVAQLANIQYQTADQTRGNMSDVESVLTQIQAKLDKMGIVPQILTHSGEMDAATPMLLAGLSELLADRIEPKLAGLSVAVSADVRLALQPDLQYLVTQVGLAEAQIGQKIEQQGRATVVQVLDATNAGRDILRDVADKMAIIEQNMPLDLHQKMKDQWYQITAQIEASRANVERLFQSEIAGKLVSFEQSLQATRDAVTAAKHAVENQPQSSIDLSPELQKKLNDHWYQMAGQIEATRANLVETVSHQIELLEHRLADKAPSSLSKTATDYGSQRQFEQQTQILSELVATLGVLDAHMQQIKVEIHARAN